ncbi:hypothetical protein LEN26_019328 [Aphanomyces euteiches]|nr:hypothetical protein LEN26_019328 [Aphanomyces euteiches]
MFPNELFNSGRLSIPNFKSISGVESLEDLASQRFHSGSDDSRATSDVTEVNHEARSSTDTPEPRPKRQSRPPKRFEVNQISGSMANKSITTIKIAEPLTLADVERSPYVNEWHAAMRAEYQSMMQNNVWILTTLPQGRKALKSKWVWKVKYQPTGEVERFKARLVIKVFLQIAGVDFTDTFAPVLRLESLRVFCALIALLDLNTVQIDIKTAFLHGDLDEEIYMVQPEGFIDQERPTDVCLLKKSLYGLKQAPRQWHKKLHQFLLSIHFKQCFKDQCVYVKTNSQVNVTTYLAVYVDDIVLAGKDKTELETISSMIKQSFEVTDKGELEYILGIQVSRDRMMKTIHIHQEKFVLELLDRFHMTNCHPVQTPQVNGAVTTTDLAVDTRNVPYQNLIGALQYLVSATRPDIANTVRFLSSHNHNHTQTHWRMAKLSCNT